MSTTAAEHTLIYDTPPHITQTATTSRQPEQTNALAVSGPIRTSNSRVSERFRRDRERAYLGRSNGELVRLLIREEYEARDTEKMLHLALERLEQESRRVTEAEKRALEMAGRFQSLNDARLASHEEAARAAAELNLYKFQYNNAQQEILRAQDILKMVEEQRDEAAAEAAGARDFARKLQEQQLIIRAREEGRRLGYEEGVRQARYGYEVLGLGYQDESLGGRKKITNRMITHEPYNSTSPVVDSYTYRNPSPDYTDLKALPSTPYFGTTSRKSQKSRQGSQSATLSPINIPTDISRPVTPSISRATPMVAPTIVHEPSASSSHQEPPLSPRRGFERSTRSPSPLSSSGSPWEHVSSPHDVSPLDRNIVTSPVGHRRALSSPGSVPVSPGSTTLSQFDIVATGPEQVSPLGRKLSIIQEASVQGDLTPTMSGRRSRTEPLTTPGLETDYGYSPGTDLTLRSPGVAEFADTNKAYIFKPGDPRGRNPMQRFADELRYSDPDLVESWRQSAVDLSPDQPPRRRPSYITRPAPLDPTLSSNSMQRSSRTPSSNNSRIPIDVQPPSTSESYDDDGLQTPGLLSPYALPKERPMSISSESTTIPDDPLMIPPPGPQFSHQRVDSHGRPTTYASGSRTPRAVSPNRDPRDKRRSKSTPREQSGRPRTPYETAPMPEGFNYPSPPRQPHPKYAPQVASSRSAGSAAASSPKSSISHIAHDRSLSMNAGMTPAHVGRNLRTEDGKALRKTPSIASSMTGSLSSAYKPYDPAEYVDPAFLASSEDLLVATPASPARRSKSILRTGKWSLLSR